MGAVEPGTEFVQIGGGEDAVADVGGDGDGDVDLTPLGGTRNGSRPPLGAPSPTTLHLRESENPDAQLIITQTPLPHLIRELKSARTIT